MTKAANHFCDAMVRLDHYSYWSCTRTRGHDGPHRISRGVTIVRKDDLFTDGLRTVLVIVEQSELWEVAGAR